MKKIGNFLLKIIAFFPIICTCGMLVLVLAIVSLKLPFIQEFNIDERIVISIFCALFSLFYGLYRWSREYRKKLKILFIISAFIVIGIVGFLLSRDVRILLLLQFINLLVVIYDIVENKKTFKLYLDKSRNALAFLNFFDTLYIVGIFFSNKYSQEIDNFFISIGISEKLNVNGVLAIIIILLLLVFVRLLGIYFYKKQNNVVIEKNRTLFNTYFIFYLASVFQLCLYIVATLGDVESGNKNILSIILLCIVYMGASVFFWTLIYESINRYGQQKLSTISNWILSIIVVIILTLLNYSESEAISILSWFVPILIYEIIGKLHLSPRVIKSNSRNKILPTREFESHLYYIGLLSFSTLVMVNIFSSLGTKQIISGGEIREINSIKEWIVRILCQIDLKSPDLNYFIASAIIVIFSMILATFISQVIMWLLEQWYIKSTNRYFEMRIKKSKQYYKKK